MFAGLLVLTACSDFISEPDINNSAYNQTGGVDTSALQAKIDEANALLNSTVVSEHNGNDIPLGTYWVTEQEKTVFQAAITAAGKCPVCQQSNCREQRGNRS